MRHCASAIAAGTLALGCASPGPVPPNTGPPELPPAVLTSPTGAEVRFSNRDEGLTSELPVSPERAWQALVDTYADYDIEPDAVDLRGHQLGVERLTRSRLAGERAEALARCGNQGAGPSAASRFRITFAFVSRVLPDEHGSVLYTRVQASAMPVDGTSTGRVACVSTGLLENRILAGVALKLGAETRAR